MPIPFLFLPAIDYFCRQTIININKMIRFVQVLCALTGVLTVCSAFSFNKLFAKKSKDVYIAGVSASFTDSLVYFTDIQLLDSVMLDAEHMLPDRSQYSTQLKT